MRQFYREYRELPKLQPLVRECIKVESGAESKAESLTQFRFSLRYSVPLCEAGVKGSVTRRHRAHGAEQKHKQQLGVKVFYP